MAAGDPERPAPAVIARCDRCGRELTTLGTRAQRNDWIDYWPPHRTRGQWATPTESCGGTFQRVVDSPEQ